MEDLNEEFQAEVVDENIANGDEEIPHNLCSAPQSGTGKADVACHPEAREESDGKLEYEGCNVRRESDEAQVEDLTFENKMIENIVQHPFQNEIQAATGRITEQLEAHHLAERRIEEVDDRGQGVFYPFFYVLDG